MCFWAFVCVVEVAKRNEAVTLTCGPKVSGDVTWKFEDDEIEESEEYKLVGPNLNVSDIDAPLLGKYSCLSGDKTLSSTHLLLEAEEDDQLGETRLFQKRNTESKLALTKLV